MPTKGGKGNSLPTSFCHCLLLPALALLIPTSFRAVPCLDQGSFDLLQTIGNIIHQRLLFPLSLPLSVSLFTLVLPTASHKSLCKALSSSLCCSPPSSNLSIMFHSLFFAFVFSIRKPKAEQDFSQFRFFFVLCHVNEQRTRLSGIIQDLSGVSFGLIESVINRGTFC